MPLDQSDCGMQSPHLHEDGPIRARAPLRLPEPTFQEGLKTALPWLRGDTEPSHRAGGLAAEGPAPGPFRSPAGHC